MPRYDDHYHAGNHLLGAIQEVGKLAIFIDNPGSFFANPQLRDFGKRALGEDNSVLFHCCQQIELSGFIANKLSASIKRIELLSLLFNAKLW